MGMDRAVKGMDSIRRERDRVFRLVPQADLALKRCDQAVIRRKHRKIGLRQIHRCRADAPQEIPARIRALRGMDRKLRRRSAAPCRRCHLFFCDELYLHIVPPSAIRAASAARTNRLAVC